MTHHIETASRLPIIPSVEEMVKDIIAKTNGTSTEASRQGHIHTKLESAKVPAKIDETSSEPLPRPPSCIQNTGVFARRVAVHPPVTWSASWASVSVRMVALL